MICVVYRELSKKQNRVFSLVAHWLGCGGEATWNFSPSPSPPVGQNRVMDRYSPPTNYWVNIKYQIRKSKSKLRLHSKSAILRAQQLFSFLCHQTLEVIVPVGIWSVSSRQNCIFQLLSLRRIGSGLSNLKVEHFGSSALCHRDSLNPSSLVSGIFLLEPSWVSLRCKEMIILEISV